MVWQISSRSISLSLNFRKPKYSLFHKPSREADLRLKLPKLGINNQKIRRASYAKFLGVLFDENLLWKEHLKYTENNIEKSVGKMHKDKPFLDKDSLLSLYFSDIHSYTNYANLAWTSTHKTILKKIHPQSTETCPQRGRGQNLKQVPQNFVKVFKVDDVTLSS